jgi:hypothetical protein
MLPDSSHIGHPTILDPGNIGKRRARSRRRRRRRRNVKTKYYGGGGGGFWTGIMKVRIGTSGRLL